jgi:hypothetical protein
MALSGLKDAKAVNKEVLSKGGVTGMSTFYGYYMLEAMAKAGNYDGAIVSSENIGEGCWIWEPLLSGKILISTTLIIVAGSTS